MSTPRLRDIPRRLFFTAEGHLDLGYVLLLPFMVLAWYLLYGAAHDRLNVSVAMWSFLGSLITSLLIAAIPIARARLLARSTAPADVGRAIAASPEPNLYTDDERGDYPEPEVVPSDSSGEVAFRRSS